MNTGARILLVEDDENLGFLLKDAFDGYGWNVHLSASGEKGLSAFHSNNFDLCILDIMLPEKDGYTLANDIRKYNQSVPIIFLTAKSQTHDRIRGFQAGADDYVCKPFSMDELKYRVEAILKRSTGNSHFTDTSAVLKAGNSSLHIHDLLLNSNGVITRLTHKECKILQLFFRHSGKLVEREVFLKTVWEDDGFFVARSMDVFVSRLRKYLKEDTALRIENIRGVGYVLKHLTSAD